MTAHIFISGFVQGVGLRKFVRRRARGIGLTGWVRNLSDGRVEAQFSGEKELIEKVIEELRKGILLSDVKNINIEWIEDEEEFLSFDIRRD